MTEFLGCLDPFDRGCTKLAKCRGVCTSCRKMQKDSSTDDATWMSRGKLLEDRRAKNTARMKRATFPPKGQQ